MWRNETDSIFEKTYIIVQTTAVFQFRNNDRNVKRTTQEVNHHRAIYQRTAPLSLYRECEEVNNLIF